MMIALDKGSVIASVPYHSVVFSLPAACSASKRNFNPARVALSNYMVEPLMLNWFTASEES